MDSRASPWRPSEPRTPAIAPPAGSPRGSTAYPVRVPPASRNPPIVLLDPSYVILGATFGITMLRQEGQDRTTVLSEAIAPPPQ